MHLEPLRETVIFHPRCHSKVTEKGTGPRAEPLEVLPVAPVRDSRGAILVVGLPLLVELLMIVVKVRVLPGKGRQTQAVVEVVCRGEARDCQDHLDLEETEVVVRVETRAIADEEEAGASTPMMMMKMVTVMVRAHTLGTTREVRFLWHTCP